MTNAQSIPCEIIMYPKDPKYDEKIRQFQGCPTLAVTKGGRIFIGWYAGGTREPHMENYNILKYSDDKGENWSETVMVIPSSYENSVHALDIQLWTAPDGRLFVFWTQNNTRKATDEELNECLGIDGYMFGDYTHAMWCMICENPDSENLVFSKPRYLDTGFLRCKPLVLQNGDWLNCNYDQLTENYGYSISTDEGKSYKRYYGAKKLPVHYDETMAYQKTDGTVVMFARTTVGEIGKCTSSDNGRTWSEAVPSGIDAPNSRLFVSRTPSGRLLLVKNDSRSDRTNMCVCLSEDDGETWKYKWVFDTREKLSYPDVDFYGNDIFLTYDRERMGAKEILFVKFTEADIINPDYNFDITVVSKP